MENKKNTADKLYFMGLFGMFFGSIMGFIREMAIVQNEDGKKEIVDHMFNEFMEIVMKCAKKINEKETEKNETGN